MHTALFPRGRKYKESFSISTDGLERRLSSHVVDFIYSLYRQRKKEQVFSTDQFTRVAPINNHKVTADEPILSRVLAYVDDDGALNQFSLPLFMDVVERK